MAKLKKWSIDIDGKNYAVSLNLNQWSGNHVLTINGAHVKLRRAIFQVFVGTDQEIMIGDTACRLMILGNKADIAVHERYINSGKPYFPLKGIPTWTYFFIAANVAIPVIFQGGIIPVMIGIIGSVYCMRTAVSPGMKIPTKLLSCISITVIAWSSVSLLYILVQYINVLSS